MPTYPIFKGNCPANVRKDAKYTVRTGKNGPVIALVYEAEDEERWHPTTDEHPELVRMVNDVKIAHGGAPNGSFYINEYKQVIVPVLGSDAYYLAGTYEKPLRFDFEGKTISGEALDLEAHPISPGDKWVGPRAGIPYILQAGGNDIRYEYSLRPNVTKRVKLSKKIGAANANKAAAIIREVRGFAGGRFYVNEFGCIFSNIESDNRWECLYIGKIDLGCWFPVPSS